MFDEALRKSGQEPKIQVGTVTEDVAKIGLLRACVDLIYIYMCLDSYESNVPFSRETLHEDRPACHRVLQH
jgi:hypothetical protein